jgi:hypothetical protein
MSHCKINGTERSILTSLLQTLRLSGHKVISGKGPDCLFAAHRIMKFNINVIDSIAIFSKLKTIEMLYGIEVKVAIATVPEMQRILNFPELNDQYMHVKSTHPNDTDDIALKCYHYLWATTKSFPLLAHNEKTPEDVIGSNNSNNDVDNDNMRNGDGDNGNMRNDNVDVLNNNKNFEDTNVDPGKDRALDAHEITTSKSTENSDDSEDIFPKKNLRKHEISLGHVGKKLGQRQSSFFNKHL